MTNVEADFDDMYLINDDSCILDKATLLFKLRDKSVAVVL